ncbi:MAG TPA: MGMT family protein, partial [Kiloniellales bacterium]
CAANPIPLFIPCHRVVAGGGRLGGFSGGLGRESKRALLAHEHALPDGADLFAPERTVTDAPLGR